jgi:uncharacterized phiE125 gp8 family phage protein
MALRLVTPPLIQPLTLEETKKHLRVEHDDEDTMIQTYIKAATSTCEIFTGRAFITQRWELVLDNFPGQIQVPKPPLQKIDSFVYDASDGNEQALEEYVDYFVDTVNQPGWIVAVGDPGMWPTPINAINSVRIQFTAGYTDNASPPSENVPDDIKAALLLTVGSFYAFRETMVVGTTAARMPWSAEQILRQYRVELSLS